MPQEVLKDEPETKQTGDGEGAPRVTFALDRELRTIALEGPVEAFSGIKREHFIGKTLRESGVQPQMCDRVEEMCDRAMVTGTSQWMEVSEGGRRFRLEMRSRRDGQGKVIGVSGSATEMRPATRERRWVLRDLLRTPPTRWPAAAQTWVGVAVAIIGVALAPLVRKVLLGVQSADAPLFLIFLVPVIAAAAIGGLWPGLLATALGTFVGAFLFVEPGFPGPTLAEYVRVGVFIVEGVLISAVCEMLRGALKRTSYAEAVARAGAEQLQESEQHLRELANAMPQIVWAARPDGFIDYYNERWYQFTGVSRDEFGDSSWEVVLHPDDVERTRDTFYRAVETGTPYEIEYRFKDRATGGYRWFLGRALPVRDRSGRIVRWYGSCTDIDHQRQTIAELEELKRGLEERVKVRTREVQQRNDELRRLAVELCSAEQRERRNVSAILHDHLQQLLAAAKMQIEAAPAGDGPASNMTAARDLVAQAMDDARTLAVELSPPVLYDRGLLAGLQWLAKHMLARHQLRVAVQGDAEADPAEPEVRDFLFAAARELLFNVVKHADTNEAAVSLRRLGDEVELSVEDAGIGCDGTAIFKDKGGFGLFNISQRTELLGGRFQFRSTPQAGCRVVLIMVAPVSESDGSRTPATGEGGDRMSGRRGNVRVLLVDDHRILREGLAALLMREPGIEVIAEAQDGLIACEMARRLRPDVIIMDVSMPNMDGIEATRVIKKELPQTRVIALSMHNRDDMAHTMQEAGADTYFTKGSPIAELARAIRSLS